MAFEGNDAGGTMNGTGMAPMEEEVAVMQPQVVVVQPPHELIPQQQPVQMMVVQPPQYQQQVLVPTQDVAIPDDNPYFASNNVVNAKRKEYMIGVDTGYFRVKPELDKLDEMKPWETDGQSYSFACCCERLDLAALNAITEMQQGGKRASLVTKLEGTRSESQSVYHKTNSDMLTVLKKEYKKSSSSFDFKDKNNKTCLWITFGLCDLLCLVGIIVAASSKPDDPCEDYGYNSWECQYGDAGTPAGVIAGAVLAVLCGIGAICVAIPLFCNNKKISALASDSQQELEIKSFSVPIYAVYAMQRKSTEKRTTAVVSVSQTCSCCAPKKPQESREEKDEVCNVTIRYKRDDGDLMQLGEGVGSIEVKLTPHQGFNLQRYLNCIIDGSHPKWRPQYGDENGNKYSLELKKSV